MRDFKYIVGWNDLTAVFDTIKSAVNYVRKECKELGANVLSEERGETWMEFYIEYPTTMKERIVVTEVEYYAE